MNQKQYDEMCDSFISVFKKLLDCEKYAVALGGSQGKGISDAHSDFDFRLYYEKMIEPDKREAVFQEISDLYAAWKEKGVDVDTVWPRSIADVDAIIDSCFEGSYEPQPFVWTLWGYNALTDLYNQRIVEDPYNIIAGWKERLGTYPEKHRDAVIKKHGTSLQYWRNDSHYRNKLRRGDTVFAAAMASRLIHDAAQVIYALNGVYYPGDGSNLLYTQSFERKPDDFEARVNGILYPGQAEDALQRQYDDLALLIDDTLALL